MRILIIEDDAAGALTPSAGAAVADGPEAEALLDQLRRRLDGNRGADSLWGGMARFGEVVVEYATQRIVRAGRYIPVTPKELRLLYALMRREGRVVTRPELMEEVWGRTRRSVPGLSTPTSPDCAGSSRRNRRSPSHPHRPQSRLPVSAIRPGLAHHRTPEVV